MPIAFHGGGQTYLTPDFSLEVLDTLMLWHTFSQPLGIQFVTACLCGGGVLERFPDLRVALLEGNCSWAPWFLYRLDEHYEWTGWYEAPESHDARRPTTSAATAGSRWRPTRRRCRTSSTRSATIG